MSQGYSLTELVVGLSIVLILAAGIPSLARILDDYRLIAAGSLIANSMQAARAAAVTHNLSVKLYFNPKNKTYFLMEADSYKALTSERSLPWGIDFAQLPGKPLIFHSRGNVVPAGSIILKNRSGSKLKVIVNPNGRIRTEGG